jgi:hypothetical protein
MEYIGIFEWLRNASTSDVANVTISFLHTLASAADKDYSNDCAEAGMSAYDPKNDAQKFARLLHKVSLDINASGLCDSGEFEQFADY